MRGSRSLNRLFALPPGAHTLSRRPAAATRRTSGRHSARNRFAPRPAAPAGAEDGERLAVERAPGFRAATAPDASVGRRDSSGGGVADNVARGSAAAARARFRRVAAGYDAVAAACGSRRQRRPGEFLVQYGTEAETLGS
eukprot:ctg_476.g263